jgi:hypothetical protein
MGIGMGFTGNLKTLSFGDILQLIATGKKTGLLKLTRPQGAKLIYFRDGNVVAASSESAAEEGRLGQLLVRRGQLSDDDLQRALKRQSANGKRLGHTLIELGIMERSAVVDALRAQVEEVVYSVFSYSSGDFQFVDGQVPDASHILVELNSLNVMMEGARRFDEFTEIAHVLPEGSTVLRQVPSPRFNTPEITLTAEEADVLVAVNGDRTLDEVVVAGANGEYVASKSLHKLIKNNLVEACPDAAKRVDRRNEEAQIYDLVFRLYSHSLQVLHKSLAEYLGACGDRLFFRIPDGCTDDTTELAGILTAGTGGSEETFRNAVTGIADPIRLHRVLDLANRVLSDKVQALRDRMGATITRKVISSIDKDVTFLIAQKRALANRYDIAKDFRRALEGA